MESFQYIVLIVLFLILSLSFWNIILFKNIKNSIRNNKEIENKDLFFELKYRIQLITTVFAILGAVITFYGYSTIEKIDNKLTEQVKNTYNKHDSLYQILTKKSESVVGNYMLISEDLTSIQETYQNLNSGLEKNRKEIKILDERLLELSNKDILKDNIYIVRDLFVIPDFMKTELQTKKYYFKDLRTINNITLPFFTSSPSINIIPTNGGTINLLKITNEYFEITCNLYYENKNYFDIWIVNN